MAFGIIWEYYLITKAKWLQRRFYARNQLGIATSNIKLNEMSKRGPV